MDPTTARQRQQHPEAMRAPMASSRCVVLLLLLLCECACLAGGGSSAWDVFPQGAMCVCVCVCVLKYAQKYSCLVVRTPNKLKN
jgi:hypothetical protein